MPNNTGMISAILAVVAFLVTNVFHWELTPEQWTGVQQIISNILVVGGLVWTVWRHWHDKGTVQKLTAQVQVQGSIPVAGPKKGEIPTTVDQLKAQEVLKDAK